MIDNFKRNLFLRKGRIINNGLYFTNIESINVNKDIIQDAVNIRNGVYAPLAGFLGQEDFLSVLNNMRLASGAIWSMPIVIDISREVYRELKDNKQISKADAYFELKDKER